MKRAGLPTWVIAAATMIALSSLVAAQSAPPLDATTLDRLVDQKLYPDLQRELPGAKLAPLERAYFAGILDAREHRVADAISELEKALPELAKSNRHRAAIALRALADDYFDAGRYGDSADAYARLSKEFRSEFTTPDLQTISDNLHTFELLRGAAAQAVSGSRSFTAKTRRDAIGDMDVPVKVGTAEMWWIFDTGANQSVVSLSTARRLGLTLSKGEATTQGSSAAEVPLHTAIIPELRFGGAVVHNVVVLVMDDKALDIDLGKDGHYAIQGILGYPVLSALGTFTLSENRVAVAPEVPASPRCTPMFVEELMPLIAPRVNGRELLFSFDTGAQSGDLTPKYLDAFQQQFASLPPTRLGMAGAGGMRSLPGFHLPSLELQLGTATAKLSNLPVYAEEFNAGLADKLYGNLGQALVAPFKSYTIDFTRMQFCVGENKK